MRLTTKSRYGTRLILDLALHAQTDPVRLSEISRRQSISLKYLGQLIIPLKIAGLIKSTRGAHGGYYLSRSPAEIKLLEILEATEGSLYITDCIKSPEICHRSKDCIARKIWEEASEKFIEVFNSITLKDTIDRQVSA